MRSSYDTLSDNYSITFKTVINANTPPTIWPVAALAIPSNAALNGFILIDHDYLIRSMNLEMSSGFASPFRYNVMLVIGTNAPLITIGQSFSSYLNLAQTGGRNHIANVQQAETVSFVDTPIHVGAFRPISIYISCNTLVNLPMIVSMNLQGERDLVAA